MKYESSSKTWFVVLTPNPTHKGEYVPERFEDTYLIRQVNHGLHVVKERDIDRIHDLLSPGYGLMIKYPPSAELPDGENQYLYPNE